MTKSRFLKNPIKSFSILTVSERKFEVKDDQHLKLIRSMEAVLNYYEGNNQSSLGPLIKIHRDKAVTAEEFDHFGESFMHTLDEFTGDQIVRNAWQDLLKLVLKYLNAECCSTQQLINLPTPVQFDSG